MGCVQSYFKRAHNAGISPSSTQESNSKQPGSEDGGRAVQEERSITEEPESNDTSYGVEATAVRTLAATTGTVAILGTTAKTGDKDKKEEGDSATPTPTIVETIPEELEETAVSIEKDADLGKEKSEVPGEGGEEGERSKPASRPVSSVDEGGREKNDKVTSPPSTDNKKESHTSESPVVSKSPSEHNQSETTSEVKPPVLPLEEIEPKNAEENASELVVSELIKEDDFSKSISSERLKTNSISNTTLSSDSIAEIENNSVKQSPSGDKVVESFDSSSTVEFVDLPAKEASKNEGQLEHLRTNPARSISSDLSNRISLPMDGEKTPGVLSPVETLEDMPPPPPLETEKLEASISNNVSETPTNLKKEEVAVPESDSGNKAATEEEKEENIDSSSKDILNNESSLNSQISSKIVASVVNDDSVDEVNLNRVEDKISPNASEDNNKAETGSPFSSGDNSSFSGNGETASPVTAVTLNQIPSPESIKGEIKEEKSGSAASNKSEATPELTNGFSSKPETPSNALVEKNHSPDLAQVSKTSVEESNKLESLSSKSTEPKINGEVSDDVFGSPIDLTDEKVVAAATTIQASFRGFQTRQTIKAGEKDIEDQKQPVEVVKSEVQKSVDVVKDSSTNSVSENAISKKSDVDDQKQTVEILENDFKKSIELVEETPLNSVSEGLDSTTEQPDSILEDVDDKMIAAATTIQANFRGFQTRQTLKSKLDSGFPTSEETTQSAERRTPTALTPELVESVKEEVDDICKEAEMIAAERSESAKGMMKGVDQVVVETRKVGLPSVSESVQAVRGSASPPSVSEETDDPKEEVFDPLLLDADENTIKAATTIQASFRGFQTRKNLQGQNPDQPDSMPDFPPPLAEDEYLQSLEDLPPPDFEALESSYSEDVPTEPLAPPPPLDQDSIIFNEEDEDELMALQRPAECDELPEQRGPPTLDTDSSLSESSLSSAATKIQAGVRGHLARKQIQAQVQSGTGTGTSTSTNLLDSDQSLSVSREEEGGVRSAISTEEESEIARHRSSPPPPVAPDRPSRSATKRMSLGSVFSEQPPARSRAPLRSAMSVQGPVPVSDEDVWDALKGEMSEVQGMPTIHSNSRGRKQLQREDAVQVTSGSSQATPSSGSVEAGRSSGASGVEPRGTEARSSGEYHDIIALSPPGGGAATAQSGAVAEQTAELDGEMVKRRADEEVREAAAATKIQATFRGFKSRQGMKEVDLAAAKIQAGFRGYKVRKEMKKRNGARRSSNPERGERSSGSVEESAATKIQAGVRGFLVRRRNQKEQDAASKIQAGFRGFQTRKQTDHD